MNRPAWRIMSEELKPCPFCGSKAISGKFSDDYQTTGWAECTKSGCSASIEVDGGEQKAITAWNTRKGEDERIAQAVAAERARIVGELREKLIRSRELLEMGHEFASEYVTAFSTAIAIAEGES